MTIRQINKRISRRKYLLNTLLKFLEPTNSLIVYLSQDLDTHIVKAQHFEFKKYNTRLRKTKALFRMKKIA